MTSTVLILISAVLAGVATAVSLVVLVITLRRSTPKQGSLPVHFDGPTDTRHQPTSFGPVERLSFAESLDADQFSEAAEAAALESVTVRWQAVLGDGATVSLNGFRLLSSKAEMIVTASVNGKKLITSGLASVRRHGESGRLLPVVTDPKTGNIIEIMKEAPAAKRVAQLTALSSMVVGAAHIIASADIAKKLKIIDGKLDTLLAYRRIDQASVLERIYTSAKELACGPVDQAKRLEMWRLRGDLRQLRSTWRRELQFHLSHIEDPAHAGWLERQFNVVTSIVVDREIEAHRRVFGKITEGQLQLGLIEYALRLDQVLAAGSHALPAFERTLADELIEIREVADLLDAKAGYITRKNKGFSVEPMLTGMRGMIEHYEAILPNNISLGRKVRHASLL